MNVFNILNGDSLKKQFPTNIQGEKIICRECFVDGNVQADSLEELYKNRVIFLSSYFEDKIISRADYKNVSNEFKKIQNIPEDSVINCWFEEDLFCQVNLWFMLYLISLNDKNYNLNLVLPSRECKYSFYDMSKEALFQSFQNKLEICDTAFKIMSTFWKLFKENNSLAVYQLVESLGANYQFLLPTINAWQENRPKSTLKQILNENESTDFGTIFDQFQKKEAIYGFGDLQVKRLLAEIKLEARS